MNRMHQAINHNRAKVYVLCCLIGVISACTGVAPVQEMSNARQTLRLAKSAKAPSLAQEKYTKAQEFLDQAVNELNYGDFTRARELALQATYEAKQAHLDALNLRKK